MANSRVLVGFSFVGTTLAAVIALFWFWNRKDDKQGKKETRSKIKKTENLENGPIPGVPKSESAVVSDNVARPQRQVKTSNDECVLESCLLSVTDSDEFSSHIVVNQTSSFTCASDNSSVINVQDGRSSITSNDSTLDNATNNDQCSSSFVDDQPPTVNAVDDHLVQPPMVNAVDDHLIQPPMVNAVDDHLVQPPMVNAVDDHLVQLPMVNAVDDHLAQPPMVNAVDDHLVQPPMVNAVDDHLVQPPTVNAVDDHLVQPPMVNAVDDHLVQPHVVNAVDDLLVPPPMVNAVDDHLVQPPMVNAVDDHLVQPPMVNAVDDHLVQPPMVNAVVDTIEEPVSLRPCYMKPKSKDPVLESKKSKISSVIEKERTPVAHTPAENLISQSESLESTDTCSSVKSDKSDCSSSSTSCDNIEAGICRNPDVLLRYENDRTCSQQTSIVPSKDQVSTEALTATETVVCKHTVTVGSEPSETTVKVSSPSVSGVLSCENETLSHSHVPVFEASTCTSSVSSKPVCYTETESETNVLITKCGSPSDECCDKIPEMSMAELPSNVDNVAVNATKESSLIEPTSPNSGETSKHVLSSAFESLDQKMDVSETVSIITEAEECMNRIKSNSDLQASVSLDSLEKSPDPEAKSGSNQSLTNRCQSEINESTCSEERCEKGDNSCILVSEAATEHAEGSDLLSDVNSFESMEFAGVTVNDESRSDCDNSEAGNGEREPSQSTESGLSRDSLESSSPTATLIDTCIDCEQSVDDDSGLQLTPTDSSSKTVVTPEKSEGQANNCDNTSEASNDSGKGASVGEMIGAHTQPELSVYQIDFPTDLCGRLIGRHGKNINHMKEKTGAVVMLRNNPFSADYQICTIEGLPHEIEETLAMIRQKFPKDRYPDLQLAPTNISPDPPVVLPDLQMNLPHGVSVDVIVSSIVNAGLVFLQQPTHPTFPSLERLNQFMLACYTQDQSVPQLPRPVEAGVICAAPMMSGWFRAMVVDVSEDGEECDIKFVDYGGYSRLPISHLRQIRSDFMTLPFQAVECYMANVTPIQGEMYFNGDGSSVLEELTQGKLLQAQVVGRAEDGIPFVHIYQVSGNKALFVNREMVNRGVARWIEQL